MADKIGANWIVKMQALRFRLSAQEYIEKERGMQVAEFTNSVSDWLALGLWRFVKTEPF